MHICYVLGEFPVTSEIFIANEIKAVAKAGNIVTVVRISQGQAVAHSSVNWISKNASVIDIKTPKNKLFALYLLAKAVFRQRSLKILSTFNETIPRWAAVAMLPTLHVLLRHKIDHIHIHFADKQVLYGSALASFLDIPFSFTMHGYDIRDLPIGKPNLIKAIASSKCVFTVSKANIKSLDDVGIKTNKFDIIPCGIDFDAFSRQAKPYRLGKIRVICVARLHPIKNQEVLLKALSLLKNQVDFELILIGDGEQRQTLEHMVLNDKNICNRVTFLGSMTNEGVKGELIKSHVHVLPSLNEGMPVANMEAMATGLICIASNVGGLPEAINPGVNGFLFDPLNPEELASIIRDIYTKNVNTEIISAEAREYALKTFNQDILTSKKIERMIS